MSKISLENQLLNAPSADKWKRIGLQKRSGVLAPLFSVYSKTSLGIGDFNDLKLLVDWAVKTGNSIVQLLPINEMGAIFCPYDSLSSFALEPAYISFELLSCEDNKFIKQRVEKIRELFPVGRGYVDYRIKQEKISLLRDIFTRSKKNNDLIGLQEFEEKNSYWLRDFALFKVIKHHFQGLPWYEWNEGYKNRHAHQIEAFQKDHREEIEFQIWVQWQLYRQFKAVKKYAEAKGILIKGDLPLLVSRDSADVWSHLEFFKLEYAAGAPPDIYCAKGQRWGMPPYNWEHIASQGYKYIKEKLKTAEEFYDILRIDHVVGLFRIWSIPYHDDKESQGLHGFFDPREENKWHRHGKDILSFMLANTNMLLCAEDLGTIPKVCTDTLKELGIPGNDVQRWIKDWKVRHNFLGPDDYRSLAVTMLSTHDTTNWAAWWQYEAGTIDEALFIRKCNERGIDFLSVRDKLFDLSLSCHGRLRWRNDISSPEILVFILSKHREEVGDFIEIYKNTFQEKEKLWKHLNMEGEMREQAVPELIARALKLTLDSQAVFCIHLIIDWLSTADIFKLDPYQYRINTPGIISEKNWSLKIPVSLDILLKHKICTEIKNMITAAGRINS